MRITLTTKLFLFVVLFTPLQLFSQSFLDSHFLQPVSKKYPIESVSDSYQMKKIVIDRDDNVYVLTDKGLYIRSEEHTSELKSRGHLVCRLLLEKKKNNN